MHCCYCGHIIKDYDYEHYINKINPNSSNKIDNIGISCKECNKEKGASTDEEFIQTQWLHDRFCFMNEFGEKQVKAYHNRIIKWRNIYK